MNDKGRKRCSWAEGDPLITRYHDEEWGRPIDNDDALFERLMLEIFQAGLSWRLILTKREGFQRAFHGFSISRVADYTEEEVERLLGDRGIIRNRKKIEAAIKNAVAFKEIIEEQGSFKKYLDGLGNNEEMLIKEFKKRFSFMGPQIAINFFRSVGTVPVPHESGCWLAESES